MPAQSASGRAPLRLRKYLLAIFTALLTARASADVQFPTDPSLPYKFGVFIGIDRYPRLSSDEQLDGCIHDAQRIQHLFATAFDIKRSILLTDNQATRLGIVQALHELVRQVRAARTLTKNPIDVVITYAGHGCRVERLPSENDPNALDNAWVASDSSRDFDCVVRGHELLEFHQALADLNAQVLIISDSCFSGNGYRGVDFSKARFVRDGAQNARGPQDDLFADLDTAPQKSGSALRSDNQPLPGFVYYSACGDNEEADEYVDPGTRQSSGRLSYVINDLLMKRTPDLTYDELAGQIAVEFVAHNFLDQHPEFHAAPGKAGDLFLHAGQRPPLNAQILNANDDGTLELNLGSLDGVTFDSHFSFYASLDNLVNNRSQIASAVVSGLTPLTCKVKPARIGAIPLSARAKMDEVRMTNFIVGLDGNVPQPIKDKLQQMDANSQIEFAPPGHLFTLAVHYEPRSDVVGFYLPSALPGGSQPAPALRECRYTGDPEVVADNLLYVARVQRLVSLKQEGTTPIMAADILPLAPLSPATQPADGLVHLREGSRVIIKLTNRRHDMPLYFWVFVVGADDSLDILYPRGGEAEPIPAGQTLEIGRSRPLTASISGRDIPPGGAEKTILKIIATTNPLLDLQPLKIAPTTNMPAISGPRGVTAADPLLNLLTAAAQGGAATRGLIDLPPGIIWDTGDVAVDVIKN